MSQYYRQCVYADSANVRELKKRLAKKDMTLSQWFRQQVRKELNDARS